MSNRTTASRQNRMPQVVVLSEALVKGNQLKICRQCKRRQVSVAPGVRGVPRELCPLAQLRLDSARFVRKLDSRMGYEVVEQLPSLILRHRRVGQGAWVVSNAQEAQLGNPAKVTTTCARLAAEPVACGLVMDMRGKCQSNPHVDVRKVHSIVSSTPRFPLLRGFCESARSSVARCREFRLEHRAACRVRTRSPLRAAGTQPGEREPESIRLRRPLPAGSDSRQSRWCRSERDREV